MNSKSIFALTWKFLVLTLLFLIFYMGGALIAAPELPAGVNVEPGPFSPPFDILIVAAAHTLTLMAVILSSRWHGWRLMLALAFAYYGCITFMSQIETAMFLTRLTVSQQPLVSLFLMGIPPAIFFHSSGGAHFR